MAVSSHFNVNSVHFRTKDLSVESTTRSEIGVDNCFRHHRNMTPEQTGVHTGGRKVCFV